MFNLVLVAFGGAIGASSRFILNSFFKTFITNSFVGTLSVNVIGSFLIGYLISYGINKNFTEGFIKYFLIIGILGSFTTFSAFSYEVVDLFANKKFFVCLIYIFLSISLCIIATSIGIYINKI